jgi:hypothetical protein
MTKSVDRRIIGSFQQGDSESVRAYIEWLRATMDQYANQIRRSTLVILVLIAAFEVVVQSPNAKISVGSFQIQRGSIVIDFVPALVAYLFLQTISDSNHLVQLETVFSRVFDRWNHAGKENDLDGLLLPPSSLIWGIGYLPKESNAAAFDRPEHVVRLVLEMINPIIVLAFEAQAYYVLFREPIFHHPLWLVSVAISSACITLAIFMKLAPNSPIY